MRDWRVNVERSTSNKDRNAQKNKEVLQYYDKN